MQEKLYYLPLSLPIEFIGISPDTCNTELEVKTQEEIKTEKWKNWRNTTRFKNERTENPENERMQKRKVGQD